MKRFAICLLLGLGTVAFAQKPAVYPAHGQSPQKQQDDEGACYGWAKQSTGIDPVAVAQAPPPPQGSLRAPPAREWAAPREARQPGQSLAM